LILPSASPARGTGKTEGEGESLPASVVRWERIVRNIAEEHGVFVVYASLVGFEGGKGFPGGSLAVLPAGEIALRRPIFEAAGWGGGWTRVTPSPSTPSSPAAGS